MGEWGEKGRDEEGGVFPSTRAQARTLVQLSTWCSVMASSRASL